jgi:serine/threonine protein kinase
MGASVATGSFPSPGGFVPPLPETAGAAYGPLHPGESFGPRYHVIRLLGMGGMGAVYQAWDAELGVAVAIKVVLPDSDPDAAADVQRRFKRELLLARQVTHKNVVRIHDLGEIEGIKYITMSFVEGADLATLLRKEGRLPVPRGLGIARHIVDGLVAAHAEGIVHRDLKPANIMIDANGDAVIMDFGIARSTGRILGPQPGTGTGGVLTGTRGALHLNRTMVGTVVGTIPYMAPEQASGQEVDQRADIYSLGLILYDMLVGDVRGRSVPSAIEELKARTVHAPASARSLVPEIPEALDGVITRCLAPDPEERYKTTADLAADLARLDEKGEPLPFRRVVGARVVAAGGVAALMLLGLTWWFGGRATPIVEHAPISVVIADFDNRTNDPLFQGTLENALGIALEGRLVHHELSPRGGAKRDSPDQA